MGIWSTGSDDVGLIQSTKAPPKRCDPWRCARTRESAIDAVPGNVENRGAGSVEGPRVSCGQSHTSQTQNGSNARLTTLAGHTAACGHEGKDAAFLSLWLKWEFRASSWEMRSFPTPKVDELTCGLDRKVLLVPGNV